MWATGLGRYSQGPDATVFWFHPEPLFFRREFRPGTGTVPPAGWAGLP